MKVPYLVLTLFFLFQFFDSVNAQKSSKAILRDQKGNVTTEFYYSIYDGDTLYNGPYLEYYSNGKLKDSCHFERGIRIGVESFYDKKGRATFIHEYIGTTFPREIRTKAFYYNGVCRYCEGSMIETSPGNAVTHGVIKYYWKNMQIMDSVIFLNDKKIYRARFNKKGVFQFETKY